MDRAPLVARFAVATCLALAVACSRPPPETARRETTVVQVPTSDMAADEEACPAGSDWKGTVCIAQLAPDAECPRGYALESAGCVPKMLDSCRDGQPADPVVGCGTPIAYGSDSEEDGRIGVLEAERTADPNLIDDVSANGSMWGDEIGEAYGTGGLGLVGSSERTRAVEVGEVVAYGAAAVQVTLAATRAREQLARCYPGDRLVPTHETRLQAVLRIDAGGRVQRATVSGGPAEFVDFRQCLAKVLGSLELASALEADAPAGVALQLLVATPGRDALPERGLHDSPTPSGSPAPRRYPLIRKGAVTVSGRLPREVIERIVRQIFGRFRLCYEQGLSKNPTLAGTIKLRFGIARDGSVFTVSATPSDLPDLQVANCVASSTRSLSFPQPEGGPVTVVFPLTFEPASPK